MQSVLTFHSILGRILPGMLGDHFGRFNTMVVMTCLSAVITLGLWIPAKSSTPIIVFSALFGFSSGAFISLAPSLIAQISDIRQIGLRTGTLFAIISVAALTGSPIGGALVTRDNGDYLYTQIFSGLSMAISFLIFAFSRVYQVGFDLTKKV